MTDTAVRSAYKPARSLYRRLLLLTVASAAITLLVTGVALTATFKEHVIKQFQAALERQLEALTGELDFDAQGLPTVDTSSFSDPRLNKPYGGLYWQVDMLPERGIPRVGVLRSRSLWDTNLLVASESTSGRLFVEEGDGPAGQKLLIVQRIVSSEEAPGMRFRLLVGGDMRFNTEATRRVGRTLALALTLLLGLLALAAWAQISIGLRPLRDMQRALRRVQEGSQQQLTGDFPHEVEGLVRDFNQVLAANAAVVERARTQAGNLAHALKTPLAVLEIEAGQARTHAQGMSPARVQEQLAILRRQVEWHLSRSRTAAAHALPGQLTDVGNTLEGLLRVFVRTHTDKEITPSLTLGAPALHFRGEEQDLQEILGNLLDNAFKWARRTVSVTALREGEELVITITDDGPGVAPEQLEAIRGRGVRLDEAVPGSGLGLAIVQEIVSLYAGSLGLENTGSGLRATVRLPAAATARH